MRFEKLNYVSGSKKRIFLYGLLLGALLIVIMNLFLTKAKYQVIESIPIANGTINYTLVDFELAEVKFKANGSQNYADVDTIEDNYELNQDMSYCTEKYGDINDNFRDVENEELTIEFNKDTKTISVKPYSKKGTKCHLFFDENEITSEDVLNDLGLTSKGSATFTGTSCDSGCNLTENGVYEAEDDYGTSYYYRGTVDNNWVVFGQDTSDNSKYIWWRIIRINGNGTIRIMYAGTSVNKETGPSTAGDETMIKPTKNTNNASYPRAVYFNQATNDNKYMGYMYPGLKNQASSNFDGAHKVDSTSTESDALIQIKQWYQQDTNLGTLAAQYIDVDTGFCSDSSLAKDNHKYYTGNGIGTSQTAYAGTDRVWQQGTTNAVIPQTPTFKCGYTILTQKTDENARKRDLYTGPNANVNGTKGSNGITITGNNALPVPVGLITMDEVVYAGGFYGKANTNYWLKTGKHYWTMSPSNFGGYARVFYVYDNGILSDDNTGNSTRGVRPVINLKADTTFTFDNTKPAGTTTNPYVVETT